MLLMNNSTKLLSTFLKRKDKFISSNSFGSNCISRIIQNLDPNKAHSHDISICMLKNCGKSISKPLEIIFKSKKVSFLMNGKKKIWFQS